MKQDDIISAYIRDMARYPLLTRKEEAELALAAQNGDKAARAKIVNSNLRFVMKVAKQYQGMGIPLSDLIGEGNVGLLVAIDRFDASKGCRFISYAVWWIKAMIRKALSEENAASGMLSLPSETDNSKDASVAERGAVSSAETGSETLSDKDTSSLEAFDEGVKAAVASSLSFLPAKEAHVIKLRYGLNPAGEWLSLKEVGDRMHISKEGVRLIEKRAFDALRKSAELSAWAA